MTFISCVIENIIDIRRELKKDNRNKTVFLQQWKEGNYRHQSIEHMRNYVKQKDMQDYVILDDFYVKLDEREEKLSKNVSDQELEKWNKYLIHLANKALLSIDWNKYPRLRGDIFLFYNHNKESDAFANNKDGNMR